jgi:hypothetical protein
VEVISEANGCESMFKPLQIYGIYWYLFVFLMGFDEQNFGFDIADNQ